MNNNTFDVVIIGSGVVGSAIARELSRYQLSIAVLEKNLDVCMETSGRNSAVLHGGFAYDPGTLKAACCVEGCMEFDEVAAQLQIPFKRTGKLLVGNTPEDMESLQRTLETGRKNGCQGLELVDKERLQQLLPAAVGEFGLLSPNSGIMDPFQFTIALAENAVQNGACYFFDNEVTTICRNPNKSYTITTSQTSFHARWIINSAGAGCVKIGEMVGLQGYRLAFSKGDYIILDKRVGPLLPMPLYPVPSNTYMGIHVTPTVDGNVIVGPNAELVSNPEYYGVPQQSIQELANSASTLWPHIHKPDYIRNYSGVLTKWVNESGVIQDFCITDCAAAPNTIHLIGIESPALTAALPLARRVIEKMVAQEELQKKNNYKPNRPAIRRFAVADVQEQAALVAQNPDYGELICRCEMVSKAEILQAIHNPLGVQTLVGIKYRTRAMMGRCQGGYCQMRIAQLLEQELGLEPTQILYARAGSNLFTGRVRSCR